MRRELDVFLWEAREHVDVILELTAGKTFESYCDERVLRLAVERVFTILGEVLVRLRKHFPTDFERIMDGTPIIQFRNRLVHLYDQMRDEDVWEIVTISLPVLRVQFTSMIAEGQP